MRKFGASIFVLCLLAAACGKDDKKPAPAAPAAATPGSGATSTLPPGPAAPATPPEDLIHSHVFPKVVSEPGKPESFPEGWYPLPDGKHIVHAVELEKGAKPGEKSEIEAAFEKIDSKFKASENGIRIVRSKTGTGPVKVEFLSVGFGKTPAEFDAKEGKIAFVLEGVLAHEPAVKTAAEVPHKPHRTLILKFKDPKEPELGLVSVGEIKMVTVAPADTTKAKLKHVPVLVSLASGPKYGGAKPLAIVEMKAGHFDGFKLEKANVELKLKEEEAAKKSELDLAFEALESSLGTSLKNIDLSRTNLVTSLEQVKKLKSVAAKVVAEKKAADEAVKAAQLKIDAANKTLADFKTAKEKEIVQIKLDNTKSLEAKDKEIAAKQELVVKAEKAHTDQIAALVKERDDAAKLSASLEGTILQLTTKLHKYEAKYGPVPEEGPAPVPPVGPKPPEGPKPGGPGAGAEPPKA